MPGKGHLPDLTERIVRTLKANTNRSAGGLGNNAAPSLVRDRLRASARTTGGLAPSARRHQHDDLKAAGAATDATYTLTFQPADPPHWPQVFAGGALQHVGTDYTLSGRELTVLDAMRLRAEDLLYCDYDYLQGVPIRPTVPVPPTPPGSPPTGVSANGSTQFNTDRTMSIPAVNAGDTVLIIACMNANLLAGTTGLDDFTAYDSQFILKTGESFELFLWSKVCDGTEDGDTVTVTASAVNWMSLDHVVYRDASPTYIDGDTGTAGNSYTTPAAAASDGWSVYVVGHAYASIVADNPALVVDLGSQGTQHRVAVFHAVDTAAAEDFTASNTDFGWASHVLTMEG